MPKSKVIKSSKSIKKIKINDKKVEVHFIQHDFTNDDRVLNTTIPMVSEVKPHLDFFNAFQALKEHAMKIMELTMFNTGDVDEKLKEKHVVTTLTIDEGDEDTILMISMNKYISTGQCYSVTSPRISMLNEDYKDISDLEQAYQLVEGEAREYLKGKNGEEQLEIAFIAA